MKSTSEFKKEEILNPKITEMPNSVKTVLWLAIDMFSLMCLYYLIFTITGLPEFDTDTIAGKVSVASILLFFCLVLIIKFSIKKDIKEVVRRQRIFALSGLIAMLSVFIFNGFQKIIGGFLFPELYELTPCTIEELEVAGIYYTRYLVLTIALLIIIAALTFLTSYLCISHKNRNKDKLKTQLIAAKDDEKMNVQNLVKNDLLEIFSLN